MAEISTVARPYAQAVFKLAQEAGDYARWTDALTAASTIARDPTMLALIQSPRAESKQLAELFIGVAGDHFDPQAQNFIRLLAENHRLALLPVITELYEVMRAEAEGVLDAEIVSALPIATDQQDRIAAALKARLGREISLTATTDPELLGGAVIRAGDMVIDGSVRGRLHKLAGALT